MNFNDLLRYKALALKASLDNQSFREVVMDGRVALDAPIPMKNVCANITQQLFDELERVCGLLDISKRAFIEGAIIEAIQKAEKIMDDEQIEELLVSRSEGN